MEVGPRTAERVLCGWGKIAPSRGRVRRPRDVGEVAQALGEAGSRRSGVIARGAGRSYGDAAQNAGGEVLDMTAMREILSLDGRGLTVTVQAGVSLAALLARLWPLGLTLPVLPGTAQVTVGGAIAGDIHGKSHHCDGSFAGHVRAISLCLPNGEVRELTPQQDAALFGATLGGMGLTGAVAQAKLAVEPLQCPWVMADLDRTEDLEQTMALLAGDERRRWSVAWIDLQAGGARMGRGLVSRADPWPGEAPPPRRRLSSMRGEAAGSVGSVVYERSRVNVPSGVPSWVLRPGLVAALASARWHRAPRRERGRALPLAAYLFPLDALGQWHRLYGRDGLVQYQLVVPKGSENALVRCVELLRRRGLPVYLAVLKRFGPSSGGPLSFPMEGFTLAMDLPGGAAGLWSALGELDEIVAVAGGRVYLCKDVRMRAESLASMYPGLDDFRELRAAIDPSGVMRSDLATRLGLCEEAA